LAFSNNFFVVKHGLHSLFELFEADRAVTVDVRLVDKFFPKLVPQRFLSHLVAARSKCRLQFMPAQLAIPVRVQNIKRLLKICIIKQRNLIRSSLQELVIIQFSVVVRVQSLKDLVPVDFFSDHSGELLFYLFIAHFDLIFTDISIFVEVHVIEYFVELLNLFFLLEEPGHKGNYTALELAGAFELHHVVRNLYLFEFTYMCQVNHRGQPWVVFQLVNERS
jgi:hypothetical protein